MGELMNKKKNAVMLADTRPALVGTVLLQLQKTNPGLFDEAIIYYVDEISVADRAVMCGIMPCRFVHYLPPLPEELFKKPRFSRFSPLMFCRYEMFAYLSEFETITWLDTDILIQGDLSRLLELAKASGAALIREDPVNKTAENPDRVRTCFTADLPGYRMDDYLYCSGTIVFTDKLVADRDFTRWCYEKTVEWADILSLPDQGVINAAIQAFDMRVTPVAGKTYCCYPAMGRDCGNALIVHAWGSNKFWNDWYLYLHYPAWREFYEEWQKLGGSGLAKAMAPLISVVIPAYKPDLQLFKQCLDSLMQQNRDDWERFSDFEIIIVAEPYEQAELQKFIDSYRDQRIRLEFNEERLGIAASLNRGLRLAQGEYVARVDDDDICAPARLYLQAEYLHEHPEINLCTSDFEYFGDMNERRVSFEGEMSRAWSAFTCPFDHPTIMFRRDFFVENELLYDEERGYVEDWELWLRAFANGMQVGCIHRVLYYHRWLNSGSAGQTSKTVDMMRELVRLNFARLGVEIAPEDLPVAAPWNGRVLDKAQLARLEQYFAHALENNRELGLYEQKSLEKAFELRLAEARGGVLPGLSESTKQNQSGDSYAAFVENRRPNILKRMLKAAFKPLYRPFRHRYEDRLIEMQSSNWRNEGHLLNCIDKLDRIVAAQQDQIMQMRQDLEKAQLELQALLLEQVLDMRQNLSANVFVEAENTRQELSAKLFTEAENTRQEISAKLFVEAENTRQELSAKLFTEAENTRGFMENRIWQAEQNIFRRLDNGFWNIYYELNKKNYICNDVAKSNTYDELFYLYNRYGSVMSARKILGMVLSKICCNSLVDFGCGTGTWLWVAMNYGVKEVRGIDGDYIARDMLMIPESCFQAADLSKSFIVEQQYDMAMSLEVAEHLPPEAADDFVNSICGSSDIILFSAAHPGQGGDGHINEQPIAYWLEKFAKQGYEPIEIKQYFVDDEKVEWWYRDNIVLFVQHDRYEEVAKLINE